MPDNFFTFIGSAITKLFTNAGFFQAIGVSAFRLTVALLLFLFGAETVLTAYFDMRKFVRLVFMILVCLTLLTYYSSPAPLVGRSLHSLITDEAKYLSDQLETGTNELLQTKLNAAYLQMETPTYFSGLALTITWFVAICLIALLRLVMLAVVGFSYMALGIIVLLGPLFIPSLIWPGTIPQPEIVFVTTNAAMIPSAQAAFMSKTNGRDGRTDFTTFELNFRERAELESRSLADFREKMY